MILPLSLSLSLSPSHSVSVIVTVTAADNTVALTTVAGSFYYLGLGVSFMVNDISLHSLLAVFVALHSVYK